LNKVTCYFTAEDVATLNKAKDDAHIKFEALRNKLIARTYKSNRGREYAVNGLIRRLDTMIRAIDYVYNILPPEKEDIPDADDRVGATIVIQSFVTNLHGCLDNLAWIASVIPGMERQDQTSDAQLRIRENFSFRINLISPVQSFFQK
jgi:hypothetical protein